MSFTCFKHSWRHSLNECPSCSVSQPLQHNHFISQQPFGIGNELLRLQTENKKLKEGLKWYANGKYEYGIKIGDDGLPDYDKGSEIGFGEHARKVLKESE